MKISKVSQIKKKTINFIFITFDENNFILYRKPVSYNHITNIFNNKLSQVGVKTLKYSTYKECIFFF